MKLSEFLSKYIEEQDISGRELARRCDLSGIKISVDNINTGVDAECQKTPLLTFNCIICDCQLHHLCSF